MKTRSELEKMSEVKTNNLRMYVTLPKGFVVVEEEPYRSATAWNPETGEVREYYYYETQCYMDSASDNMANGHFDVRNTYTVSKPGIVGALKSLLSK